MTQKKGLHRLFYVFSCVYLFVLSYEILGSILYYERCESESSFGLGEVLKFFAFCITFTFFLIPLYSIVLLNGLFHHQETVTRFFDMCQPQVSLGYRCFTYQQEDWKKNTSTIVHYGSVVFDRGFECTKYITLNVLFLLQCIILLIIYQICGRNIQERNEAP